jgi:hypothetical protein
MRYYLAINIQHDISQFEDTDTLFLKVKLRHS